MIKKLILCFTFFFAGVSIAQTSKDTVVAFNYFKKADSLLTDRNYKESIALFDKALSIYEKTATWDRVASCYNKLSESLRKSNTLEKSVLQANKALEICHNHLTENHPEEANAYDNIGYYYRKKGNYKNVLQKYQKALDIRKKRFSENNFNITKSYNNIAMYYYYTSKFQLSITYFKKVLAIYQKVLNPEDPKIGTLYLRMGGVYYRCMKYDLTLAYYKKSLAITIKNLGENHLETAYTYTNISTTYNNLGRKNLAFEYAKKSLLILKREQDLLGLGKTYNNIGTIYFDQGEYNKAIEYLKKSINIKEKIYGKDHIAITSTYMNLGSAYQDSEIEKTLSYYYKVLRIRKEIYGENSYGVANLYQNLGIIYLTKKEYDSALRYNHKALKIRQNIFDKNHLDIAISYFNLGSLYLDKGEYDSALKHYESSLDIMNKSQKLSEVVPNCYREIGMTYHKQQDYEKALTFFDKALISNTKKHDIETTAKIFDPERYYFKDKFFNTLLEKAKTLYELYKKNQTSDHLNQSVEIYQNLDLLVDYFRESYQNYEDKISLAEQAKEMYNCAIKLHLHSYKKTKNQNNLEQVFYYMERSKSNILKDLLNNTNAKNFSELPEEIIALESTLKSNRAFYQSQIVTQQSKDSIDISYIEEYENKLFDTNRKQDSLAQILEKEYPRYYQSRYRKKLVSVEDIQDKINDKTTVLEFFVADSSTYAFIISKNAISIQELPIPKLTQKIQSLNKAITSQNNTEYIKVAHTMYQELLLPVKGNILGDELIIIPDGALWHLNFDLLLTQQIATQNSRDLPYLLRDYTISYANSAHLLFDVPERNTKQSNMQDECLAFSFSDTTSTITTETMSLATLRDVTDDLPGTREEIRSISEIFDGEYYYGSTAKEINFKENSDRYKIIHLALHAEVDHKNPQNSKLYFNQSKDNTEDNLLYAHELFALNIPAELTVLSACNTGMGKIANGEGIMSLGNAFQYAGTKSLLLSSWEVSDKTTPTLMKYFYTNLKDGMGKAKALQQAKLKYITTAEPFYTNPFYWGSFYLLGDTNPITINTKFDSIYLWGLLVLVCLGVFLIFFIKKRVTH